MRHFDDVIIPFRRKIQMGDQPILISLTLKYNLAKVTINRHQSRTGPIFGPDRP